MISLFLVLMIISSFQTTTCQNVIQRPSGNSILETPDDADMWKNTPAIILLRGFGVETHRVVTDDGYILIMFRIVNPTTDPDVSQPPVLLQHGAFSHSDVWLINSMGDLTSDGEYLENGVVNDCDPSQNSTGNTIGFVLAACGYDVWLGNFRGNDYSNQHLRLKITDPEYWNFTAEDFARHDIKAMIDYVIENTDYEKVSYAGHSVGGLSMFMLLALEPSFAQRIQVFISVSSLPLGNNFNPLVKSLIQILIADRSFVSQLNVPLLFPPNVKFNTFIDFICNPIIGNGLCQLFTQSDLNPFKFTQTEPRVKSSLVHTLLRMGFKVFAHFSQVIVSGRFQRFDYGCSLNRIHYKQCQVPAIRMSRIRLKKIAVFYGKGDQAAGFEDLDSLKRNMRIDNFWREFRAPNDWGHYDYILNFEAGRWSVPKMLQALNEARKN